MITIVALAGRPRFPLGRIVSTPGALEACAPEYLAQCLTRHAGGDWGLVGKEDAASNDRALKEGGASISNRQISKSNTKLTNTAMPITTRKNWRNGLLACHQHDLPDRAAGDAFNPGQQFHLARPATTAVMPHALDDFPQQHVPSVKVCLDKEPVLSAPVAYEP